MYKSDVDIINIQIKQLGQIVEQLQLIGSNMDLLVDNESVDKDSLKAYVASADIIMISVDSQKFLVQQALDKLAEKLK